MGGLKKCDCPLMGNKETAALITPFCQMDLGSYNVGNNLLTITTKDYNKVQLTLVADRCKNQQ